MDIVEAMQLINDCQARESRLSDWEREFIESVEGQLVNGRSLTKRQAETLDSIWERATAKG